VERRKLPGSLGRSIRGTLESGRQGTAKIWRYIEAQARVEGREESRELWQGCWEGRLWSDRGVGSWSADWLPRWMLLELWGPELHGVHSSW
jgi:hypothetical protein